MVGIYGNFVAGSSWLFIRIFDLIASDGKNVSITFLVGSLFRFGL